MVACYHPRSAMRAPPSTLASCRSARARRAAHTEAARIHSIRAHSCGTAMHTRTHTRMHTRMHTRKHTRKHTHVHMHMHTTHNNQGVAGVWCHMYARERTYVYLYLARHVGADRRHRALHGAAEAARRRGRAVLRGCNYGSVVWQTRVRRHLGGARWACQCCRGYAAAGRR